MRFPGILGGDNMKKVLIPTRLDAAAAERLRQHGGYDVVQDDTTGLDTLADTHPDAYALIVRSEPVDAGIIDRFSGLKVIIRAGAGTNTIDTRHARSRNIDVMNTPGANANAVAEEVVALMLADARQIIPADASTRAGQWEKKRFLGRELHGKTVGLVGLGNIGQLTATRLSGFKVRLLGYDPMISKERAKSVGVELVADLETLFRESDFVSLHIPETSDTRHLVGERLLTLMKPGATLVNCARAGIVDEDALRRLKPTKQLHFLNDVYPKDEEGPKSVADIADIMLPHLGANTAEANRNAALQAAEELIEFDDKGVTAYIVNRDIPDGLDRAYCELANALGRLCRCLVRRTSTPKRIETSIYGDLAAYADWLLTPIVAGICDNADRSMDYRGALAYLEEMGIRYHKREVDESKGYGNSITVDLTVVCDAVNDRHVSVRGTITEGMQIISRINEFDRLYFEPAGRTVLFLYDDRPGVIGRIGNSLAEAGVNIEDMRNPHDAETNRSLAILKVNAAVTDDLIERVSREIDAVAAFYIEF